MELALLAMLILGAMQQSLACTYTPARQETTVFGTKKYYCDYVIGRGNSSVKLSIIPGSRFRTSECSECHCTRNGLQCCGYGIRSANLVVPNECKVLPDGCEPRLVLKSDNKSECKTTRPPVRPRLEQTMGPRVQTGRTRPQVPQTSDNKFQAMLTATRQVEGKPAPENNVPTGQGKQVPGHQGPKQRLPGNQGKVLGNQGPRQRLPGNQGQVLGNQGPRQSLPGNQGQVPGNQGPRQRLPGNQGQVPRHQAPRKPGPMRPTQGKQVPGHQAPVKQAPAGPTLIQQKKPPTQIATKSPRPAQIVSTPAPAKPTNRPQYRRPAPRSPSPNRSWRFNPFRHRNHMNEESMQLMQQMMLFQALSSGNASPLQGFMLMNMLEM
ncbi:proline-rich protein 2-like [Pecten maximus]|uniref:proline-rich protein 2-like n=1 Tax=Pecten maximus TaxID=6579 RepID=UPI0014591041|nr:proline-rich protein 2-like [Pecten maximus]